MQYTAYSPVCDLNIKNKRKTDLFEVNVALMFKLLTMIRPNINGPLSHNIIRERNYFENKLKKITYISAVTPKIVFKP